MKTLRLLGATLLALTAVLGFGVLSAAAQGPTGVAFLDNQSHTVAANASTLYQFTYALNDDGSRPVINITMPNGTNSGLGFQIWTADTVNDMADNKPVGQGTPANVECTASDAIGICQSPDLTWQGSFGSGGTYYVLVTNSNNSQTGYALKIQGSGVSLGQQLQASAPSAPAAAPALNAASSNNDDPTKAAALDASQHTLTANGATWYRFDYGLSDDGSRPVVTIRMPNGNNSGLGFQVWSADAFTGDWWNNKPIGMGTVAATNCDTGAVSGGGLCTSNDLSWQGAFGAPGTYYVRVINNNSAPANYTLSIQ